MTIEYAVRAVESADPDVLTLATEQQAELAERYGETHPAVPFQPDIEFLMLRQGDEVVGCVGLQPVDGETGEIKRMYVRPAWRGRGLSRLLLAAVEQHAVRRGVRTVRLETGVLQPEAVGLYRRSGYHEIPRFAPYEDNEQSVCFARDLTVGP